VDHTPHTDDDLRTMLDVLGLTDVDQLFDTIPPDLRTPPGLLAERGLGPGVSEADVLRRARRLAGQTTSLDDAVCWLGGGAYDHYVPAVVSAVTGRGEFATAYTPYQPEMSQGTLQALFEFQTLVSELLGLPVANSSLYDGATALVEGVLMCTAATGRDRVVLAGAVAPHAVEVLATLGRGLGLELVRVPPAEDGRSDLAVLRAAAEGAGTVVLQQPNAVGLCEDVAAAAEAAQGAGARLLVSFDPLLAGVLEPPGRLGADVVVADGLSTSGALSFGGPGVGLLACRQADVRRLPGRLVGQTVDSEGRRGWVLTLQAREQHIRRDRATSNICTNQSLNALATAVHYAWLGPAGLVELGEACLAGTAEVAARLDGLAGPAGRLALAHPHSPYVKEFALRVEGDLGPGGLARGLARRGHLVGPVLADPRTGEDLLLLAVTEQRTLDDVDDLVKAVEAEFAETGAEVAR
jgi:glycine dehydrogenase subunit 1